MARVFSVALIALLIVAGGVWLDSRRTADGTVASTVAAQEALPEATQPSAPPGFELVLPLADEQTLSFAVAESVLEDGADYHALLDTTKGQILIDLLEERAPKTVNNFVFLALNRYYEGVPFHRVLEDFMAQTGDPTGTGRGGPGYTFADEIHPELQHDARGTVSMANSGPDSNGSQFFITLVPTPWLDGRHAVFGQVIEGEEVLSKLQRVDPSSPTAVLRFDGALAQLAAEGVTLDGPGDMSLRDHLEQELGALPAVGQTFNIGEHVGVVGRVDGVPTAGFFPMPDTLEAVNILVRASDEANADESGTAGDGGSGEEPQ
ncbi:MAG: peptidylprolyl isomerase [Trueperaceae bacterium]